MGALISSKEQLVRTECTGCIQASGSDSDVVTAPDTTSHFLNVVDEREAERAKARARYLSLMRMHIEKQLKDIMARENVLKKRKKRREKKAKVSYRELSIRIIGLYVFPPIVTGVQHSP